MKYRYILNDFALPGDPVCKFRLVAGCAMNRPAHAIRIEIPDDMVLSKRGDEPYAITQDVRLIKDLNPTPVVRINSRMRVWDQKLLQAKPCDWPLLLMQQGYRCSLRGYVPDHT